MSEPEPPVKLVEQSTLQEIYNKSPYPELIRTGQLRRTLKDPRHVKDLILLKDIGGEFCSTYSTGFTYEGGKGHFYVHLHAYIDERNGNILAKGRLDPKVFIHDGKKYKLKRNN